MTKPLLPDFRTLRLPCQQGIQMCGEKNCQTFSRLCCSIPKSNTL